MYAVRVCCVYAVRAHTRVCVCTSDVNNHTVKVSQAFGALLPVFLNRSLTLYNKRGLYMACI